MVTVNPADSAPVLDVDRLRFRWPGTSDDVIAVDRWQLARGAAVFLRGPSGSGKSTLLSLLAGVLVARAGAIKLLGQDWRALSPARRDRYRVDHVGYIFQQFNLLPYLSAVDNVLLPCRFSPRRAQAAVRAAGTPSAAAARLLDDVGLTVALRQQPAAQLSVGQQQRVAAARALIGAPELIIADEPTSALDEDLREAFMAVLLGACTRSCCALVFVSHDARLAERFDTRIDLAEINRAGLAATGDTAAERGG